MLQAEKNPSDPQDGNGQLLGYSFGELLIEENGGIDMKPLDGSFQGVSYGELYGALHESLISEHDKVEPLSPCGLAQHSVEDNVVFAKVDTGIKSGMMGS